jgi:hypothetical protein
MQSRHVSLRSVIVPCTLALEEAVTALCARTGTDPSVLARAGLVLVQERPELAEPDPGAGSFERVGHASASGERVSRLWLPRLRLSAPSRSTPEEIRIALATLLALCAPAKAQAKNAAEPKTEDKPPVSAPSDPTPSDRDGELARLREENAQLRTALDHVAPKALPQPPRTAAQAAWLMGFAHEWGLTPELVTGRYRQLARIFHPDTGIAADSSRMAQLTAARGVLMQHLKT